ncbi:MAG: hypothetical protein SOZ28_01285 [Clostridia bacterium]|nr:hypothetical protein [Clostridia bacterium]
MNRLTKKSIVKEIGYVVDNPTVERCVNVIDKLGEYEDAEENGLLVRLPCKVGDTVWIVDENSNEFDGIDECRVSQVIWNGTFFALIFDKDCYGYSESYIGKTVFLTREEAGKALEEDKQRAETEEV